MNGFASFGSWEMSVVLRGGVVHGDGMRRVTHEKNDRTGVFEMVGKRPTQKRGYPGYQIDAVRAELATKNPAVPSVYEAPELRALYEMKLPEYRWITFPPARCRCEWTGNKRSHVRVLHEWSCLLNDLGAAVALRENNTLEVTLPRGLTLRRMAETEAILLWKRRDHPSDITNLKFIENLP